MEAMAMIGVTTHKTHLPLPRACQAKATEAIKIRSARESKVTRSTGCSGQNPKLIGWFGPIGEPVRAWSSIPQIQKTVHPAVNNARALTEQWLPLVKMPPSSYSGSTYVQLSQTAMPPATESGQR